MPCRRRAAGAFVAGVLCLGALVACSSDDGSGSTPATTVAVATTSAGGGLFPVPTPNATGATSGDAGALPRVDLIGPAVAALDAQLGGPQQYFEINATSKLVNLIIAVNNATLAQTWLYLDGQLTSKDAQPASGHTFAGAALTFDPATVLAQVHHDLPDSVLDFFYVLGGTDGSVQYKVDTTSSKGGQLEVTLGPDGTVQEVDPLDSSDTVPASTTPSPNASAPASSTPA